MNGKKSEKVRERENVRESVCVRKRVRERVSENNRTIIGDNTVMYIGTMVITVK